MLYLLDADTLITSSNKIYKMSRFMPFWMWLLEMATKGSLKIPHEQFDEIAAGNKKDDPLVNWLTQKEVSSAMVLDEEVDSKLLANTIITGYAPDLSEVELVEIGKDPFLIAYASLNPPNRCVVSFENSKPGKKRANSKIPDVCKIAGVRCITIFEMLEELDFKLK